jgi:hypothetical protein
MLLLGKNIIYTIKKTTELLLDSGKKTGLEINMEKTKYMFIFHHQKTGQNNNTVYPTNCSFKYAHITTYFEKFPVVYLLNM